MAANAACISKLSSHTISLSALKAPRPTHSQLRSQALSPTCAGSGSTLRPSFFLGRSWDSRPVDKKSLQPGPTVQLRRVSVRAAGSNGGSREPWDFSRFLKTVLYFNEPPKLEEVVSTVTNPSKLMEALGSVFSSSQQQSAGSRGGRGKVLVVGATGGVGKRIVDELRKNGVPVVALVRDQGKAQKLLGPPSPGLQIVTAELTQPRTLLPEYFEGVSAVVNASAVIVGPKEGDTTERAKYYQGIKFYDPEIKENTPEAVEFRGVQNLVEAVKEHLGYRDGKVLLQIENGLPSGPAWGALDDVVMGGISESGFQVDRSAREDGSVVGVFRGFVSSKNSGGFASIRTRNFTPPLDLTSYEGLSIRLKGTGKRFKFIIRTDEGWDTVGYTKSFDTKADTWQTVQLPFSEFVPVFRARTVTDKPPFNPATVYSFQLMFSKFESDGELNPTYEDGAFELPVASIKAYLKEPITPKFVHVGSAGVTRPGRPGLDLDKQPPAVRMNDQLGGLLTYKLKGEDVVRSSGVPYTIIRPCALTEEPAGAELQFDQGDNITGKIGREEVARICVAALASPEALDKTFEVKSTVPFSVPFEVDPSNPPPPRDYTQYFSSLKEGVTGKLEKQVAAAQS
ncbi:NAD(P)-binding Rossmann-fold superfamily protein [Klebsormidium nitens]|uniref:NAD(P)-binding Rossmann-fold superfamily protein n=1 Tax=Klebsormidium nitens TaxID=105231 RepID=A0A1Y1HQ58_KLENI|nr:NAD(P)-binding Rossmann-fold superfamily protein [Klebsormidium nitens]|eukprot:GAQ79922.1 NAD(P)-binding Rossmann-fold superfamily protein [Klebsormidium nitens]